MKYQTGIDFGNYNLKKNYAIELYNSVGEIDTLFLLFPKELAKILMYVKPNELRELFNKKPVPSSADLKIHRSDIFFRPTETIEISENQEAIEIPENQETIEITPENIEIEENLTLNFNEYQLPESTSRKLLRDKEDRLTDDEKKIGDILRKNLNNRLKKLEETLKKYVSSQDHTNDLNTLKTNIHDINNDFYRNQTNPRIQRKLYNTSIKKRDQINRKLIELKNNYPEQTYNFLY